MTEKLESQNKRMIFDVGMHQGEDTAYYLKRGFKVVAFEANPILVRENQKTFADSIATGELTIVEGAIVDDLSSPTVTFYVNEDSSVWGTVNPEFAERNEQLGTRNTIVEVNAIDFRECLKKYGMPYFMKIDIEGADLFCLDALNDFPRKPTYISIESNKVDFNKLLNEIHLLENLGYDSFKAVQQAGVPQMKVPERSHEGNWVDHSFSKEASGLFGSDLPGEWQNKQDIIDTYRSIFRQYRLFGDDTFWQKNPVAFKFLKGVSRLTGRHYPGWYDTHARHESYVRKE